jgi:hypothetical protein
MFARSPMLGHPAGPWMAHYLRAYVLGDPAAAALVFGNGTDALLHAKGVVDSRFCP